MEIKYRIYQKTDFNSLAKCMEKLQDFLIRLDPLKRLQRAQGYGKLYTEDLLKKIAKHDGIIILAQTQEKVVGCAAGIIEKQSKTDLLDCVPTKTGRILEIFVSEDCRGQGIGKELMKQMEEYIKQKKCDVIRIEVFEPNKSAHEFYKKRGYSDRIIDLIKFVAK